MKKLFILLFVLATVMVANAQDTLYIFREDVYTNDNYNFEEGYLDITDWCVNSDTLIIYDGGYHPEDPYDVYWANVETLETTWSDTLVIIKGVNEGLYEYYCYSTGVFFRFMITLATEPEELKTSFDRDVPLGEEIFAYDLINDVENPKLSIAWDDGESGYSRTACEERVYTVTVSDSCGRQVTNTWRVGDWTGTHESLVSTPCIFPNPAHGSFTVKGEGTIVVFNAVGQKVRELETDSETTISDLPAGMYFVQIGGSGNVPQKVVVVE